MISTNNPTLRDKCKSLRNLCFGKKNRFNHDDIGWNYRMTNIQAAIGCAQMESLNFILSKKRDLYNFYKKKLAKNVQFLTEIDNISEDVERIEAKINSLALKISK